ncbi:MAG: pro-sigmaK processing inhibitor BofA family protein [Ectobacillus sp.]
MHNSLIILGAAGLIGVLLLAGASLKPLRFLGKTFVKVIVGAIILFVLNMAGAQVGLHIPINIVTASISGILGLPGLAALAVIQMYIIP